MEDSVASIIRLLGGVTKVVRLIHEASGETITDKAVQKWRERGSIPARRLIQLDEITDNLNIDIIRKLNKRK